MAVSYKKASAERRANVSDAGAVQSRVFEGAFAVAMQVVELREKHGLTQVQLAERSGIDQGDISRIERGSAMPNEKTLIRIADALNADLRLVPRSKSPGGRSKNGG
jgi:ribosome-binding protein aMBF1 (putative translation factor)